MIDLRSDTVTQPTAAMRRAMASAEVGDDVLGEDPTINELEQFSADLSGKEAALFTPSGTFANQLAMFTWVERGAEVYISENAHIIQHEAGASACISAAFMRTIAPQKDYWLHWSDIQSRLRSEGNVHYPVSSLICVENALWNGTVQPLDGPGGLAEIKENAQKHGLHVHMDGARIFNAAAALSLEARDIACYADSLMFCLSKGLAAPVGSMLCGPKDFIEKARYRRKIMGGGMRQAGILAAAGLVALKEELPRLGEDHQKAQILSRTIEALEPFEIVEGPAQINMVFMKLRNSSYAREQILMQNLRRYDILTYEPEGGIMRFVMHRDVSFDQVTSLCNALARVAEEL